MPAEMLRDVFCEFCTVPCVKLDVAKIILVDPDPVFIDRKECRQCFGLYLPKATNKVRGEIVLASIEGPAKMRMCHSSELPTAEIPAILLHLEGCL